MLDLVDETLHQMPLFVQMGIIVCRGAAGSREVRALVLARSHLND